MPRFALQLEGPVQPKLLVALTGTEPIHRPYRLRATCVFAAGVEARDLAALVGQRALVAFDGHATPRRIAGVVERVRFEATLAQGELRVRLLVVAALDRLRHRKTRRIYQDATTLEILVEVFTLHRLRHRFDLLRSFTKREYCVQYRETDLEFVLRLCAEEGLTLTIVDPGADEREEMVVITDHPGGLADLPGDPTLLVPAGQDDGGGLGAEENHARNVVLDERSGPDTVLVRRYDPMRPLLKMTGRARWDAAEPPQAAKAEPLAALDAPHAERAIVYESHAEDENVDLAADLGQVLLEQLRPRARELGAQCRSVRLAPGRTFRLQHVTEPTLDGRYVLVEVRHDYRIDPSASSDRADYEARVRFVPAGAVPRPRPPAARPLEVTETAIVVGPPGQEIHTDAHGRVKVQFHWDIDGRSDDGSSCWIRVAQPWAGPGFGAMFLPRVGMEVIVAFVGGDPDRPVVMGALYNGAHATPFHLPKAKTLTGIITRSSPGGEGAHELSFDDAKGRELARLASERDLELTAKNDARVEVGADRSTNVTGDDTLLVQGNLRERVVGSSSVEVQGKSDAMMAGDVSTVIMGKRDEHVQGVAQTTFGAGAVITSESAYTLHVEGEYSVVVGNGDTLAQTSVEGRLVLGASKTVTVRAEESIRLQVGSTVLEVSQDGIKLTGAKIALKAEEIVAEGDGPKLTLGEEVELVSEKIGIYSKKGGLEMEDATQLWGQPLKLNPPRSAPPKKDEESETKTKPFKVKLTDAMMEPYAGKKYVLFAEGMRLEGDTGGDGGIDVEIPEEATGVDITCWIDQYPTGRKKTWSVRVSELPPANAWPGALTRLHNLGYYSGGPKEKPAEPEKTALKWFQKEHGLEETGELDGSTASELESVHGS